MIITSGADSGKTSSTILDLGAQLEAYARSAAGDGTRQYDFERETLRRVLEIGHHAVDLYLGLQEDGDLGPTVATDDGQELFRSETPIDRPLRTVFGEHGITSYVYAPGAKKKIALRPIDARIELPASKFSYLYEEFSQHFCVEQAFATGAERLGTIFGVAPSVDSLEVISRRLGDQAGEFLDDLPQPDPTQEGELLVLTADGKGVPLVKHDAERVPCFEQRERPGNRRMATLGGIYSVDRYDRQPEQVLAALFREEPETPLADRPKAQFKYLRGCFNRPAEEDGEELSGILDTFRWLREQAEQRHRRGQPIVLLMDGQQSQWDAAALCLADLPDPGIVEILDLVHVAGYVWDAAKVFETTIERREAFVWTRLGRILSGDAKGVISGMRRMATCRAVDRSQRKEIDRVCGYFENNLHRMRYDEYLREGYPIATGVIEGACRHLVKDRMERSGMRWTLDGAQAMLNVRAVVASSCWNDFNEQRMAGEQQRLHPHAKLVRQGNSHALAC